MIRKLAAVAVGVAPLRLLSAANLGVTFPRRSKQRS
jgi:hypothetical protein